MDQPLLADQPAAALPTDLTLEDLKGYVESMSEDTNLEFYLRNKLQQNKLSFTLPEGDEITAMCKMQDGFVVGLKSGKVMLISPPVCEILEVHSEPIVGVFAASNFFVLIASAHNVKIWGLAQTAFLAQDQFPTAITCVAGNMLKELIFIGLEDGTIEVYSMPGKNTGELLLKFTMQKIGEPSPVYDIKTNDTTTWLAVRYLSDELAMWDHETNHMMYHFSFDGPPGLPSSFIVGEWKKLPGFFKPPEGWDVFPNLLIFSSGLIIRMAGNTIAKMYGVRRLLQHDDATWLAYSDALKKGYMPFRCHDFIISFTPPGAEKKKPSERNSQVQEIELDLAHFFTFSEKSEANNYIAFACEKSVEIYCLAAINSKFTHRPAGALAITKSGEAIYARFCKLYNSKGEALKPMDQRELFEALSPDGNWVVTRLMIRGDAAPVTQTSGDLLPIRPRTGEAGIKRGASKDEGGRGRGGRGARGRGAGRFRRGASRGAGRGGRGGGAQGATGAPPAAGKPAEGGEEGNFTISICSTSQPVETVDLREWSTKSFLKLKFMKNGKMLGLLFKEGLVIYSFEDRAIIREIPAEYEEPSFSLKCSLNKALILAGKGWYQAIYAVQSETPVVKWPYNRLTFIKDEKHAPCNAIAYSMTSLALGQFNDSSFNPIESISTGFEKVKILKNSTILVGNNDFGFHFYSIPDLRKLLHFEPGLSLTVSQDQAYVYALSAQPTSPSYTYIDVWDLELGLKVQHTYSGLRHVVENKLTVKGPGMWRDPDFASISASRGSAGVLKETWKMDLSLFAQAGKTITKADMKDVTLNEEDVEYHCMAWKSLVRLLSLGEISDVIHEIVIRPFNINILHLLAHRSQANLLAQTLNKDAAIIQSAFGTPIHIAIEQKSRASLDALLKALISLKETNPASYLLSLYHIHDDLPSLVRDGSSLLPEFIGQIIVPVPEQMCIQTVISPNAELPKEQLTASLWVNSKDFDAEVATERTTVEYLVTPFPVYIDLGSRESISALKTLTDDNTDMNLFKTLFVRTIINLKWSQLWWFIFLSTVLYWILLGIMSCIMLHYFDHWAARGVFIGLNTWFLIVEMLQMSTSPREYVSEYWNYVDLTRTALSYWWAASGFQPWITFMVMLLSLLRGISTFETFDATRFYVRMILVVTKETLSFIWVFFYSTLSFGLLFATVNPDESRDFFSTWMIPYELNMGNFDVHDKGSWYWMVFMVAALVNVIIMLNLVVSILGDAFDKFQSIAEAVDILGKAEVLYEYERMMWWRRDSGRLQYLQMCRPEGQSEGVNEWSGKVEEMKKELKKVEAEILAKMNASLKEMKAVGQDTSSTDRIMTTLVEIRNEFNEKLSALRNESSQEKLARAASSMTGMAGSHLPAS